MAGRKCRFDMIDVCESIVPWTDIYECLIIFSRCQDNEVTHTHTCTYASISMFVMAFAGVHHCLQTMPGRTWNKDRITRICERDLIEQGEDDDCPINRH